MTPSIYTAPINTNMYAIAHICQPCNQTGWHWQEREKNNFGAKAVPISIIQAKRHISGKITILDSGKITTMDSGKITTMDSGKVNFPF